MVNVPSVTLSVEVPLIVLLAKDVPVSTAVVSVSKIDLLLV